LVDKDEKFAIFSPRPLAKKRQKKVFPPFEAEGKEKEQNFLFSAVKS
jgi:hypothetical protein